MTSCGMCQEPLSPDNRSLYFCDASCQDQWMTQHGEKLVWSNRLPEDDHALSERIRSRLGLGDQGKEVA